MPELAPMTLWFVFALMTAAAIFAVLWPLGRSAQPQTEGKEAAIYRDQLAEIDRDVASARIGPPEAMAARVEISRRLLAAADDARAAPSALSATLRRAVAVVALAGLPITALAFYLPLGSPGLGDYALAERDQAPVASQPLDNLVGQVEAHLEKNPKDGRGWMVLAPVLAKLGRFDDSVRAYRNSIAINGDRATLRSDLAETLTAAAGGVITTEAKAEFERALALDASDVKASYFLGLAAEQDGRVAEAASIWRATLEKAPPDAPYRALFAAAMSRVGGPAAPVLSEDAIASAKDMNDVDRSAMIHGMIDRLASRLKQNGDDVDGWLRLARAYMVLGESEKARSSVADARQAVSGDAQRLRALNDGLKQLGLDG